MRTINTLILLFLLLFYGIELQAQTDSKDVLTPWQVGVKGGVPFGMGTFTSFGEGKTKIGYNVGLLSGYSFNRIFSLELSAAFGKMELSSAICCADYWLGSDGVRYLAPVTGRDGHYYRDLYSSVVLQQYGLQLNMNLLPIFNRNTESRFSVLVSPVFYGIETQATIKTSSNEEQFIKEDRKFNFGVGGDIAVGYRLTNNLSIRLSSGVNYLIMGHFDGMPLGNHKYNIVWNNDISVIWSFGKKQKKRVAEKTYHKEEMLSKIKNNKR